MAENNDIVFWHNSYSIGIELIDEQHMHLFTFTNGLFASCMSDQCTRSTYLHTIHEAIDYVDYHFGTEHKLMERIHYPDYGVHKQEHISFSRELFGRVEEFCSGKTLTPLSFVYYLKDWINNHIAISDKKLGEYLKELWRSGELLKISLMLEKEEAAKRTRTR